MWAKKNICSNVVWISTKMLRALERRQNCGFLTGQVWLGRAQQNIYFAAGGRLADALYHADAALRSVGIATNRPAAACVSTTG